MEYVHHPTTPLSNSIILNDPLNKQKYIDDPTPKFDLGKLLLLNSTMVDENVENVFLVISKNETKGAELFMLDKINPSKIPLCLVKFIKMLTFKLLKMQ